MRFEEKMKEVKDRDLLDLVMFSLRGGGVSLLYDAGVVGGEQREESGAH